MDLSLRAKFAPAVDGIDLSLNKIRYELPLLADMPGGPSDGCIGNRTQEFDESGIIATLASDPELNALDMAFGIGKSEHELTVQNFVNRLDENRLLLKEGITIPNPPCSLEDVEIDFGPSSRHEADYAAMDLTVHMNHTEARLGSGIYEQTEVLASSVASSLKCGMNDFPEPLKSSVENVTSLQSESDGDLSFIKDMEGYIEVERATTMSSSGQTTILSHHRETLSNTEVNNCHEKERNLQFSAPCEVIHLQEQSKTQSVVESTSHGTEHALEGQPEGKEDSKRKPEAPDRSDPFMNLSDFLELETKVANEASVETHATEVTFTCTACGLSFSSTGYLSRHARHCRKPRAPSPPRPPGVGASGRPQPGEKPFACPDCPARFSHNCDLTKHRRRHTGERPYACDACPATFALVSNLSKHRKKHTGEKPHACADCGAAFAESGSLTRHSRQHTGERPYACADCGATFGQSGSLTRHRRSRHTGERPHACADCDARFAESGNLSTHRRLHTGEKPYACPRCGLGHARLSYLKNHARTCHVALGS